MLKTRITELFGIKYPVFQGAMLWLSPAELAASVSNAGGLGIIASSSYLTADDFRREIRRAKDLTDKPFAVNVSLLPSRRAIPNEDYIRVAGQEGVKIIETSGRSPESYIPLLRESRAILMHKAARIRDLQKAERLGFDAVTIVGHEAGGHPGMDDTSTIVLVRQAAAAVKIPVIAGAALRTDRAWWRRWRWVPGPSRWARASCCAASARFIPLSRTLSCGTARRRLSLCSSPTGTAPGCLKQRTP